VADPPTQPNPIPRACGSCLTDPSASVMPFSGLQTPAVDSTISSMHESLPASPLVSADHDPVPDVSSLIAPNYPSQTGTHPMHTRSKLGIFKPSHRSHVCTVPHSNLFHSLFTMREPKGVKSAVKHPG